MNQAPHPDHFFLEHRKSRRSIGLYFLPAALVALMLAWIGLWSFWPLAVNPFTVVGQIEQRAFEPGALTMYAVIATVLMNVVLALIGAGLVLGILWARHERRYHRLLEERRSTPKSG